MDPQNPWAVNPPPNPSNYPGAAVRNMILEPRKSVTFDQREINTKSYTQQQTPPESPTTEMPITVSNHKKSTFKNYFNIHPCLKTGKK